MVSLPDHIGLEAGRASVALLCGDPERAAWAAERLGASLISGRRGFDIYLAERTTPPLAVIATGIGGPATAIVAEELVQQGVRVMVRLGSCGALDPHVRPSDVVVSSGCASEDGTSAGYLPAGVPAVPHAALAGRLAAAAEATCAAHGVRWHFGLTHCKDVYYAEKIGFLPHADTVRCRWKALKEAGVLATEMEAAALFAVAQVRGVAAAALFVVVGKAPSAGQDAARLAAFDATLAAIRGFAGSGEMAALTPQLANPDASFLRPGALDEFIT